MSEKALNLHGSITDGQVFNLKKVLHRHPNRPLKTEYLARLYSVTGKELNSAKACKFAPLPLPFPIAGIATKVLTEDELKANKAIIDNSAFVHVQKIWPDSQLLNGTHDRLDIKDQTGMVIYESRQGVFEFEMKEFSSLLVTQGSSNYSFDPLDKGRTKYRSYENRADHLGFILDSEGDLIPVDDYAVLNPAQVLLNEINTRPHAVKRLSPFIKTGILKATAYAANFRSTWSKSPLQAGDNIIKLGRPAYFSVSQFTYHTNAQYLAWKKSGEKLKRKYGESFELFFSNPDGTLDFSKMITTVDKMIRDGVHDPLKLFDPFDHIARDTKNSNIMDIFNTTTALRNSAAAIMLFDDYSDNDEWDYIETSDGEY
jgi:hypothetical protein